MRKDTTEQKVDDLQARELTDDDLGEISGAFAIIKLIDKASPKLYEAACPALR